MLTEFPSSHQFFMSRLEKLASAVRETSVSRHNRDPIEGPPSTAQYNSAVMVRGVLGRETQLGDIRMILFFFFRLVRRSFSEKIYSAIWFSDRCFKFKISKRQETATRIKINLSLVVPQGLFP